MTSYNVAETPPPWYEHRNDIQAVDIQSGVTEIGSEALRDCVRLTRVVIPDGVTKIRSFVFYGCEKLESVTIPAGVTQIEDMTFFACPALKDIHYAGSAAQWGQITIRNQNGALDSVTIHYNSAGPEPTPTPAFSSPSAPTVSGGAAITRANVGTLTEITVPVSYSGDTAQTVTFAVPFFDGSGKFIGMGMTTETVTSSTRSVTVPVRGLSGSERMKVLILTENFCPLSPAGSYDIPG